MTDQLHIVVDGRRWRVDPWGSASMRDGGYTYGPMTNAPPQYCLKCGLRTVGELRRAGPFDGRYGMPKVEARVSCPRRNSWWDGHTGTRWTTLHFLPPMPPPPRLT